MRPEQTEQAEQQMPSHNIAMWGAPGCGKTTFLAALDIALDRVHGDWKVVGADGGSTEVLTRMSTSLAVHHEFPEATRGIERYKWCLVGQTEEPTRRWWNRGTVARNNKIGLDVLDATGELFASGYPADRRSLFDSLVASRGIVYLFDPIREYELGDAYENLHGVLAQISQRMLHMPEFTDGRLPHYLAICVTKFDEVRVLKTADRLNLLSVDPDDQYGFPRIVDDEDARRLFEELCDISASGNAELVLNKLTKFFRPDRVRFFATSAIGFHLDPRTNRFDPRDYQNLMPDAGSAKGYQIRSGVYPINVMEPLLWLAQRLSADQRGEASR